MCMVSRSRKFRVQGLGARNLHIQRGIVGTSHCKGSAGNSHYSSTAKRRRSHRGALSTKAIFTETLASLTGASGPYSNGA